MTRSLTATAEVRLRPAVVATLITLTFLTGIGAGLGLARVAAGPVAHQAAIGASAGSGTDMSSAAYSAAHQAAIDARSGSDMSAVAYSAAHRAALARQAAIGARSGSR